MCDFTSLQDLCCARAGGRQLTVLGAGGAVALAPDPRLDRLGLVA